MVNGSTETAVCRIEINFNVNHSVDADCEPEVNESMNKAEVELKAKPTFEVDLKRGGHTLGFTCSFISVQPDQGDDSYSMYCYDSLSISNHIHNTVEPIIFDPFDQFQTCMRYI